MTDEKLYTLKEARRALAREECIEHGHLWEVITTLSGMPTGVVCDNCGRAGRVVSDD